MSTCFALSVSCSLLPLAFLSGDKPLPAKNEDMAKPILLIKPYESSSTVTCPALEVEEDKSIFVGVVCGLFTSISGEYRDSICLCSKVIFSSSCLLRFPGLVGFPRVSELVGPVLKICMVY